ncbi:MAG TPA: phosphoribosylamine--glycine ligase [Nitrospiraceae bacterium]|nr:phosphoribosylamine--glycine ligase [Nitrospiraceae bacterium]
MKILVIGSGGREHALAWKLAQSPRVSQLFCAPGNAGIESLAQCVPIASDDIGQLKKFVVSNSVDLTIVGPEAPLALGIADDFRKAKLKIFGPTQGAARIESSKSFAKDLMARNQIPTAAARSFEALAPALAYLDQHPLPVVVKADGLAQGKGVVVAATRADAQRAVFAMLEEGMFGQAGRRVIVEEFLAGEEVTIMAFTDGRTVTPMLPSQDHKRVGDEDTGANTGGMGAYAPTPIATPELLQMVDERVFRPIIDALARLGSPFQGVLYAGLMIVNHRPYVLEFNARFGDPETQVILPLLKSDLVDVIEAVVDHRLDQIEVAWHTDTAVCVVLTSGGYPGPYTAGRPITGLDSLPPSRDAMVFHAGTQRQGKDILTAGGRVVGVTGIGRTLTMARERAYQIVPHIAYEGCHFRTDIAGRGQRKA